LDVVSGGRAYFGIGAGWNDQEAKALGLLDPLSSKRFIRLEDTLKLALKMWSADFSPFKGEIYDLPEPYLSPQPVSRPHPPILIGGGGEEKTLRFVAQYADACNLFARDMEQLKHKLEVLKDHCVKLGRNYDEIEKTCLAGIDISSAANSKPDTLKAKLDELKSLGVEHVIYANSKDADVSSFDKFSTIVEYIHDLH
jgi:alkanesulfonate monooxygenase SsuD/methylene tetrahydromethanopterin reductase-like flavin-dependent oxidoreductase (luciferase family)